MKRVEERNKSARSTSGGVEKEKFTNIRTTRTFNLPLDLILAVREEAKRRGIPMCRLVEEAVRFYLASSANPKPAARSPAAGGEGVSER